MPARLFRGLVMCAVVIAFSGGRRVQADGDPAPAKPSGADAALERRAAPIDDLVGVWGGEFHDAKLIDTLLIRVGKLDVARASGGWSATVDFTFVVKTEGDDELVRVEGSFPPGRVEGDAVKFPATKLTRTIVSTGAQNAMDSNPLEIRLEPDGRLEAKFVGEGGFTLTMAKRQRQARSPLRR